jgi:hypothetical protein
MSVPTRCRTTVSRLATGRGSGGRAGPVRDGSGRSQLRTVVEGPGGDGGRWVRRVRDGANRRSWSGEPEPFVTEQPVTPPTTRGLRPRARASSRLARRCRPTSASHQPLPTVCRRPYVALGSYRGAGGRGSGGASVEERGKTRRVNTPPPPPHGSPPHCCSTNPPERPTTYALATLSKTARRPPEPTVLCHPRPVPRGDHPGLRADRRGPWRHGPSPTHCSMA